MKTEKNLQLLEDFLKYQGDRGRNLYKEIHRYIRSRFNGNEFVADDVMGEMQLNILKRIEKGDVSAGYNPSRKLESWLYAVASNACVDYQRRNKRWATALSLSQNVLSNSEAGEDSVPDYGIEVKGSSPLEDAETKEQREILRAQVYRLPARLRQTVELVYFQGKKYGEAAEILQIPLGTVKSRLHAGLEKLEEFLLNRSAA